MGDVKTAKRRLPSAIRWILWVLLVQFILINISSVFYAYRLTHFYAEGDAGDGHYDDDNIFLKTWKLFTGPKVAKAAVAGQPTYPYETVQLTTKAGKKIEAWYSKADSVSNGTVILFHGISNTKSTLLPEADEFRALGYRTLLVDLRGHGNSEGNSTSLGVKETEEVKLAYDFIVSKGERKIILYGSSMGAVVVAKAMHDYQWKVAGIMLDMPFQSLQTYLKDKARTLGFPSQPFAFLTTFWIGVQKGYNGFNHSTTRYVKDIHCPVLMQWGSLDNFILREETQKIFNTIGTAQKKLVIYERAGHESFAQNDPLKWRIETERFLATAQ